jgi:hypothetical protein
MATSGRVARWYIFRPKIPFWVHFGVVMEDVGIFMTIWYILRPIGKVYGHLVPVLVCCAKKNLATLTSGAIT